MENKKRKREIDRERGIERERSKREMRKTDYVAIDRASQKDGEKEG